MGRLHKLAIELHRCERSLCSLQQQQDQRECDDFDRGVQGTQHNCLFGRTQILQVASWAGFGREAGCRREREEGQGEGGEGGGGGEEEEEEGGGEGGEGEGGKELMTTFDNSVCDP